MKKSRKPSKKSSTPTKGPEKFVPQFLEDPDDNSYWIVGGVRNPHKKVRKLAAKSSLTEGTAESRKPQIIEMNEPEPYGGIAFVGGVRPPKKRGK